MIVSAIHLDPSIFLDFTREFFLVSRKKGNELLGAGYPPTSFPGSLSPCPQERGERDPGNEVGYPLVWYILKQLFTSVSVKSGRYLPPLQ